MPRKLLRIIDPESFHKKKIYYENIGRNSKDSNPVVLNLEEYEAIRLYYYHKLSQAECSLRLNVSQPTFSRILRGAVEKLAEALVEDRDFEILGGNVGYEDWFGWGCWECDHEWKTESNQDEIPEICPKCGSNSVYKLKKIVTIYK